MADKAEPIELEVVEEKPKKQIGRKKGSLRGAKHLKILELRQRGIKLVDIAKQLETDPAHVSRVLKKWEKNLPGLKTVGAFKEARANILGAAHEKVLNFMTKDSTLKGARAGELAKIADVVYRQERLETGQSTSNKAEIRYTKVLLPDTGKPPE